jgi:predicted nucleotidyltransferase
MEQNESIEEHPAFIQCKGQIIGELIAGSRLYQLDNESSDIDFRGLFIASDPKYIAGFDTIESIVQDKEVDSTYYELTRYLKLLRKSNTQVLEILFCPDEALTTSSKIFRYIRENKYSLIDSNVLKSSLKGYVFSEMKLATGERSGRLGGNRKNAVEKYSYSPKNFVQILRLCEVGIHFFNTEEYMVRVKDVNPSLHTLLMEIKNTPENFTKDQLSKMVEDKFKILEQTMDESKVDLKFDAELASHLILAARDQFYYC